jgi:hypothetical protein
MGGGYRASGVMFPASFSIDDLDALTLLMEVAVSCGANPTEE